MSRNRNPLRIPVVVAVIIIAAACLVRHFHIKNFHTVIPGILYTSGQPRGMDYTRLLYRYHIATFINVRQSAEHRERNWYNEEMTWVQQNGVNYVEMPIEQRSKNSHFPSQAAQKEFLDIMAQNRNLPVLIHGGSGRERVAMLAAVWLVKAKGYETAKVIEVVETIKGKSISAEEEQFIKRLAG